MFQKKYFSAAFFIFSLIFIFSVKSADACSCGPTPTVLESFDGSDQVVILKAVSVEKTKEGEDNYAVDGVKATKMVVEKVYKGTLKVGDQINFVQGGGADCIWTFNEKSIGEKYLFYLDSPKRKSDLWSGFGCGRSGNVEGAANDLLYLDNLSKVRGKTRIAGEFECWSGECPPVDGRKVEIIGKNKTYHTKTNKNGIYEIYDLPAGEYFIEPEVPNGWKVSNYYLRYSRSFIGDAEVPRDKPLKQFPILLEDKKHASLDFHLEINNSISGKIFDPNGKPMKGVCIKAVSTELAAGDYRGHSDCTEADGSFSISEVSPDNYILVVNDDGKIDSDEPFGTLFYPGVVERDKAAIVSIRAGEFLKDINVQIPAFEEIITVEGRFLYADGKPVVDELCQI